MGINIVKYLHHELAVASLDTRRQQELKCAPQLFLESLLGTRRSAIGWIFYPCPKWQSQTSLRKLTRPSFPLVSKVANKPFPSSPGPLYQNEIKFPAFDMEMIFHTHANKTHFHEKGCALGLILKVRVFGTRKWPIWRLLLRSKSRLRM